MNAEKKNINTDDLNGITTPLLKVITKTIQEPDPVKFSALCEALFGTINNETFIAYSVSTIPLPTQRGTALVYIGNLQYWGTEQDYKEWLDELKRNNLFIKP